MRISNWNPAPIHEIPFLNARKGGGASEERVLTITRARISDLPASLDGLVLSADLQGRELLAPTHRQRRAGAWRPREGRRLLGEVAAEQLRRLCERGDLPAANRLGVVLAGDFWAEPGCTRRGGLGKVGPVWSAFGGTSRWVVGVLGNHDQYDYHRAAHDEGGGHSACRVALLDGDLVDLEGLRVGGVGGIIGDPSKPRRKSAKRFLELLENVLRQQPDLVILHEPPEVPEGACLGKPVVRDCLLRNQPTLLVCGHCHWPTPLQTLANGTQVCNVDSRLIVALREVAPD
jgi:Icc-related predicted phosphoesterase